MNGALILNKHEGVSSFGIIETLQRHLMEKEGIRKKDLPKLGHGGTLDPFATGTLVVLVGNAVKLARYFLGATKSYRGVIRFGETSIPGDPTGPISETSPHLPQSLEQLQDLAHRLTLQAYLQTPPMHSAKKQNGKPLYELARAGIEVERTPKLCHLYEFEIIRYEAPLAHFSVKCSSGTYIRTLAQDFGKMISSVALLQSLHRTSSGVFHADDSWTVDRVGIESHAGKPWDQLPCWIPFHQLLNGYPRAEATPAERDSLIQGQQKTLVAILQKAASPDLKSSEKEDCLAIYTQDVLVAVARKENEAWTIERVFPGQR